MALDGITVFHLIYELKDQLLGGRIDKIYQPNTDEIILSIRSIGSNFKLLLSANSSHPRIHITKQQKENPMTPPMFCMVMRKHLAGGKIVGISQPNFERIVILDIDSMDEMGDKTTKHLILEIMGKHSNLILTDENHKILDSIKHISHDKSSVRQVLPGYVYTFPPSQGKQNPLELEETFFLEQAKQKTNLKLQSFLYQTYTGISPIMASEICFRAGLDPSDHCGQTSMDSFKKLFLSFQSLFEEVKQAHFYPEMILDTATNRVLEFSPFPLRLFSSEKKKQYDTMSFLLEDYYKEKDNAYHIAQKAHDMRRLVLSNIERCVKKKEIQIKTREDIKEKDLWKLKGELITANIYAIKKGQTSFQTVNFYELNSPKIEIALDPTKTPSENAQKYFNRYNKAKRTLAALDIQEKQNEEELEYLENVLIAIENSSEDSDLTEIREELAEQGFVKKKKLPKGKLPKGKKSSPYHFVSSDGYDIYVGKSNTQNDELTLHFAQSNDLWLHTKNIPGSHVIVKLKESEMLPPDQTLLEAAILAVYHSKAKQSSNVPVDYTKRKNVKKPRGAKPGMVIYEQNKTLSITVDEKIIHSLKEN